MSIIQAFSSGCLRNNCSYDNKSFGYTIPNSSLFLHSLFLQSLFRRIFPTIYSYRDCILTFYLEGRWSFLGYLSHHFFAGGGRVGCRVWGHYLGVILPLIWLAGLVQCIKCGGDRCFIWKLPPCIACTSLLPSLVFSHIALVVRL